NDATTRASRKRNDAVRKEIARVNRDILALMKDELDPTGRLIRRTLPWSKDLADRLTELKAAMQELHEALVEFETKDLSLAEAEIDRLRQVVPYRVEDLDRLRRNYYEHKNDLCALLANVEADPTALDPQRVIDLPNQLDEGNKARTAKIADLTLRLE